MRGIITIVFESVVDPFTAEAIVRIWSLSPVCFQGSYVRVEVSGRIVAVGLFRGSGKCQLLRIVSCQLFPRCSTRAIASRMAKTATTAIEDRIAGVEQVGRRSSEKGEEVGHL